jgi:pimeloyl-ACP methyl ester carboxylesterase
MDNKIILSDGRKLGFREYGDLNGFPVFAFHGLPGSRIWFKTDDDISKANNVHLITVDRPGFGNSDKKKNRTILDFADDVFELANSFGFEKYSVLGTSGGGAYALAIASKYPEFINKCTLISTVNEFKNAKPPAEMASENRNVFMLSKRFPWLLSFSLNQQRKLINTQPENYLKAIMTNTKHLCDADKAIMENKENAELVLLHMKEAFKQGVKETVREARLFTKSWGFSVKDIRTKVDIWHGIEDTLSPINSIRELEKAIPNCKANYIEGKGHFLTEYPQLWQKFLQSTTI